MTEWDAGLSRSVLDRPFRKAPRLEHFGMVESNDKDVIWCFCHLLPPLLIVELDLVRGSDLRGWLLSN